MRHEIGEDIEDLGSQWDESPSAPQFIALRVEAIVAKHIAHRLVSSLSLHCAIPPYQLLSGATSYGMRAPGVQPEARAMSAKYRLLIGKVSVCCRVTRPWYALCSGRCVEHGSVALVERSCRRT